MSQEILPAREGRKRPTNADGQRFVAGCSIECCMEALNVRRIVRRALLTGAVALALGVALPATASAVDITPNPGSGEITDHYGVPQCCPYTTDVTITTEVSPEQVAQGETFTISVDWVYAFTGDAGPDCETEERAPYTLPLTSWTVFKVAPGASIFNPGSEAEFTIEGSGTETRVDLYTESCPGNSFRRVEERHFDLTVSAGATSDLPSGCYQPAPHNAGLTDTAQGTIATIGIGTSAASCITECSDNLNNDFDGLIDHSSDPGCFSPSDPSELGIVECDNGVDDDSDGRVDWPGDTDCAGVTGETESPNCLTSPTSTRGTAKPKFTARVVAAGLPDMDLFRFEPFLTYCYDGVRSEIMRASVHGDIDWGLDTYGLALLGFEARYDFEEFAPQVLVSGNRATFRGDFDINFNWLVLLSRFGGNALMKKAISGGIEKGVKKILQKEGYNDRVRYLLADTVAKAQHKWGTALDRLLKKLEKGPLKALFRDHFNPWLRQRVDAKMAETSQYATAAISSDNFSKLTADQIGSALTGGILQILQAPFPNDFSVWTPLVDVQVSPTGEVSVVDTAGATSS